MMANTSHWAAGGRPSATASAALRVTDFKLDDTGLVEPATARQHIEALLPRLPATLAARWKTYLDTPRARLYERRPGQGGFTHGMAAMLVAPARTLPGFAACQASVFGGDDVTVLGISLPIAASARSSGLPALFHYDPARLQTSWRPPRDRQDQVMALPLLLPGWRAAPAGGFHAGWAAIAAAPECGVASLAGWLTDVAGVERAALLALTQLTPAARATVEAAQEGTDVWNRLNAALEQAESLLAEQAVQQLLTHLHPVVMQGCMAERGCLRPAEYNWVAGGATARAWQWRMQALREFTALCTSAVLPGLPIEVPRHLLRRSESLRRLHLWAEDEPVRGASTLSSVVDQGLPLVRQLASTFRVSPSAVRALRGVGAEQAPMLASPPLGWPDLLQALDGMAPEHRPRTPDEWRHFEWFYEQGLHAWRVVHGLGIEHGQTFLVHALRPWLAQVARQWGRAATRWRDGFRGVQGLEAAAALGADLPFLWRSRRLRVEQRALLVRYLSHAGPPVWQMLVNAHAAWQAPVLPPQPPQPPRPGGAPLPGGPRLAPAGRPRLWDQNVRQRVQRHLRADAAADHPWYELPDLNTLPGLPPIRPLNSAMAVQHEGEVMRHCLNTYRTDLALRRQVAFAIGGDHDTDRSTVMLDYARDTSGRWRFNMMQHHAARNFPTTLPCRMSVVRLLDVLGSEGLRPHIDVMEQDRIQRHEAVRRAMLGEAGPGAAAVPPPAAPARPPGPSDELLAASRAWHAMRVVGWLRGDFFGPGPRSVVGQP